MASILQVEQIKGPTSGASANKITIPSGQTLDASNATLTGIQAPLTAGTDYLAPDGDGSSLTGISGGKVLQVVQSVDTTPRSVTLNSGQQWNDWLSVNITPSSTSSKILVFYTVNIGCSTKVAYSTLYRGGTAIVRGDTSLTKQRVTSTGFMGTASTGSLSESYTYLDSPSTTSQVTYTPRLSHGSGGGSETVYMNRDATWGDSSGYATFTSQITAMEISA